MTPDAASIAKAYEKWVSDEISEVPSQAFQLGKFLTGTSSGAVGTFVAVSTFAGHEWSWIEWIATAGFGLAAIVALLVAMPPLHNFGPDSNVQQIHREYVIRLWALTVLWMVLWFGALAFAVFGLLG